MLVLSVVMTLGNAHSRQPLLGASHLSGAGLDALEACDLI